MKKITNIVRIEISYVLIAKYYKQIRGLLNLIANDMNFSMFTHFRLIEFHIQWRNRKFSLDVSYH